MYKCCLCGKEYLTESAVVKCVNRCGREMSRKGIFQPKEAPYSEGTTTVDFGFNIEKDNIKEQIVAALDTLLQNNVPAARIETLKNQTFINWENKTIEEKEQDLGRIIVLSQMFS